MQSEIIYENGWVLTIPKNGNGPMLFLEWLSTFNAAKCPIHKVANGLELLKIRLNGKKEDAYKSAMQYINDNL